LDEWVKKINDIICMVEDDRTQGYMQVSITRIDLKNAGNCYDEQTHL